MKGFYLDYAKASTSPEQIMQAYSPNQVQFINKLAAHYAVSDQWFASSPTQTWPNRAFVHCGTSNGQVNNWPYDPFDYDIPTIFNTLEARGISWNVYNDTTLESLTRLQFPQLWHLGLDGHFHGFDKFKDDAKNGKLPAYSFLEPSFQIEPNDDHPPHDVTPGEQFLFDAWYAVVTGKNAAQTLFLITYDEHGGCYDHSKTMFGAATPDANSNPGQEGFYFNRFGVRVPTILVSPYTPAGTVFRTAKTSPYTPYDHTSVLMTLQKWKSISVSDMPPSARTQAAPDLGPILTLASPRTDVAKLNRPDATKAVKVPDSAAPSEFQVGMAMAAEIRKRSKSFAKGDAETFAAQFTTRKNVIDYLLANAKRKN
jgi:phospholipase C